MKNYNSNHPVNGYGLNAYMSDILAQINTTNNNLNNYLLLSGGTMTGTLNTPSFNFYPAGLSSTNRFITNTPGGTGTGFTINSDYSGTNRRFDIFINGNNRTCFQESDSVPSGTNFALLYDHAKNGIAIGITNEANASSTYRIVLGESSHTSNVPGSLLIGNNLTNSSLTTGMVLYADASKNIKSTGTSNTVLGYLDINSSLTGLLSNKADTSALSNYVLLNNASGDTTLSTAGTARLTITNAGFIKFPGLPIATNGLALAIDSSQTLTTSSTTKAELDLLSGVSSNVQGQLNSKANSSDLNNYVLLTNTSSATNINNTFGNINLQTGGTNRISINQAGQVAIPNIGANKIVVTDGNTILTASPISTTKLGYLTDVTGNIGNSLSLLVPLAGTTSGSPLTGSLSWGTTGNGSRLKLYDNTGNDYQYLGLGLGTNMLQMQMRSNTDKISFRAGVTTTTDSEVAYLDGNGNFYTTNTIFITNTPNAFPGAKKLSIYGATGAVHNYAGLGYSNSQFDFHVVQGNNYVWYESNGSADTSSTERMRFQNQSTAGKTQYALHLNNLTGSTVLISDANKAIVSSNVSNTQLNTLNPYQQVSIYDDFDSLSPTRYVQGTGSSGTTGQLSPSGITDAFGIAQCTLSTTSGSYAYIRHFNTVNSASDWTVEIRFRLPNLPNGSSYNYRFHFGVENGVLLDASNWVPGVYVSTSSGSCYLNYATSSTSGTSAGIYSLSANTWTVFRIVYTASNTTASFYAGTSGNGLTLVNSLSSIANYSGYPVFGLQGNSSTSAGTLHVDNMNLIYGLTR